MFGPPVLIYVTCFALRICHFDRVCPDPDQL